MKSWTSRPVPTLPGTMPAIRLFDTAVGREVVHGISGTGSRCTSAASPRMTRRIWDMQPVMSLSICLNRVWRDAGHGVDYVQNVTDVDDPLLERATATNVDWRELAQSQIDLFQTDMEALNVLSPDHYVGAVESISLIVPRGGTAGQPGPCLHSSGNQRRA